MKDVYIKKNGQLFFKIKEIKVCDTENVDVYCFEMKNTTEPYFTLANGIVTHNCRLCNGITDNKFSHTLGAGGLLTGSINVITMNLNRLIQDGRDIVDEVKKLHKYHFAYRKIMENYRDLHMFTAEEAGYIFIDKLYSTIGVNGIVEAAEYMGIEISNNYEYKDFISSMLRKISKANKEASEKYGCKFNTEFVPAENLGVKFAQWDKADGYKVNRDCYNSYFYKVEDENIDIVDKFILHGRDTTKYLDGGSALHLNLVEHPDAKQYIKLCCLAANTGCKFFVINVLGSVCEDCGKISPHTLEKCEACGSTNISYTTRVIGYTKKIKNFSKERQTEADERHYH